MKNHLGVGVGVPGRFWAGVGGLWCDFFVEKVTNMVPNMVAKWNSHGFEINPKLD